MKNIEIKNIICCKNFKSAFEKASNSDFDIALIDLCLGKKTSGLQLVKLCKSNGIIPIVLSGLTDKEKEVEKIGAVAFGDKSKPDYI
ncbi:MAG: hypothetical protein HQK50_17535, partial [Oligoflexia bacterium]|nr:hypothetical protein [Oligoflexia bacterium]